ELQVSRTHPILEVIGVTLLALIVSLSVSVVFIIFLLFLGYDVTTTFAIGGAAVFGQIGFLLVAYFYIDRREINIPLKIPSKSDLLYIGGGTTITLITSIGVSQIFLYFDLMPDSVIDEMAQRSPIILIVLAVLSVVLIAPAEELLFRGAIQGKLREHFQPFPAIAGASILFGSLHLLNYTGGIISIIMSSLLIMIIGGMIGVLYERTENLTVPILVHGIYNFVLLVSSYYAMV
ncbi:MAG: CPBP family intramembrane glutamic endopeptidase, partial [Candidatus Saliniplasma sp.]